MQDLITQERIGGLRQHAMRRALNDEVHTRPPVSVTSPVRAAHLAMLSGEDRGEEERRHLAGLCGRFDAAAPPEGANHHLADLGPTRIKWERHTEFSTYTLFRDGPFEAPFAAPVTGDLPADWLAGLPGHLMVAIQIAIEPDAGPERSDSALTALFDAGVYVGSRVAGSRAAVWTDFRIHEDGFSRILIRNRGLGVRQAGRLVQRLAEIETYRMMALLAFPMAREVGPQLSAADGELAGIMGYLGEIRDLADEGRLLDRLTRLAVEAERIGAETSYRFSAARAYHVLVERRVEQLREQRIEGLQTIGEFMSRRLTPAMRTCESVADRQRTLSERIHRASALLRTRVDLGLEIQNQAVLQSMDRRARLQLRLQQTVEGLSVAAISYYLISIVKFGLQALQGAGAPINVDLWLGGVIPVVVGLVWYGVVRVRRIVEADRTASERPP